MTHRKRVVATLVVALIAPVSVCAVAEADGAQQVEPSTWGGTFEEGPRNETVTVSDGDLWPTCWALNDSLYTAWGDGVGFDLSQTHNPESSDFIDIGVARVDGDDPAELTGVNLALKDEVLPLWPWDPTSGYYRKPTGMLCDGNTLYLAIHKMDRSFGFVQQATGGKSDRELLAFCQIGTSKTDQPHYIRVISLSDHDPSDLIAFGLSAITERTRSRWTDLAGRWQRSERGVLSAVRTYESPLDRRFEDNGFTNVANVSLLVKEATERVTKPALVPAVLR